MPFSRFVRRLAFSLLLLLPLLAPAQRRLPTRPAAAARPAAASKLAAASKPAVHAAADAPAVVPPFAGYLHSRWVDSLMRVLTPRQRVGQLFMVAAYSNKSRVDEDSLAWLIRDYGIGGMIFFQGGPVRQARMLNRLQARSPVPLLVAMDGEWGAGMRLDSVLLFPSQMSLGAVPLADSSLIYDMGREIAGQFRRLGMQVNFAPVVDVNNNPGNPVIGFRSWGENPAAVARLSGLYLRGMQDAGVLAVAKHFPGHGDVDTDSHLALPIVRVDRGRLDTLELPPFRSVIGRGVGGVMVAHLNVPALDNSGTPTTLSPAVVTGLLRQQLGFRGVVFTDAMTMQGVLNKVPTGEAEVRALLAGNDILEFSKNVPVALRAVLAAVASGRITQQRVDESCRRVLALKQWAGLHHYQLVAEQNLYADLHPPHARYLSERLTRQSITLLRNQRGILPLQRLDTLRVATLVLGGNAVDTTAFQRAVADYLPAAHFYLPAAATMDELENIRARLFSYDLVLVALQNLGRLPATSFGVAPEENLLLRELTKPGQQVILSVFGSAYAVARVRDFDRLSAVVQAYEDSPTAQRQAVQVIFGGTGAVGKLPVTVGKNLPAGFGLRTQPGLRLTYGHPEAAGMDNRLEARVDSLMQQALASGSLPGGQVLVARRGVVVLRKSYGTQQAPAAGSDAGRPVRNTDVYDLDALTEPLAAVPALLKLQEQGKFSLDSTLEHYFPSLSKTNKARLTLRDGRAQAGGQPFVPEFGPALVKRDGKPNPRWFGADSSAQYPLPVGPGLWGSKGLPAQVYAQVGAAAAGPAAVAYLYPGLVQQRTGQPLAGFLDKQVYRALGRNLRFQPLHHFAPGGIVPTAAANSVLRPRPLRGYAADETTALLGGVSGHAGLFGSANDVAQLAQAYAWGGRYGGQQLFDKSLLDSYLGPAPWQWQGRTGTYCWVNPTQELVVVLLTNQPGSQPLAEALRQVVQRALR